MTAEEPGRLGNTAEDFKRAGISAGGVSAWEDGKRLADGYRPGEWEWWYSDAHFTNGMMAVASFHLQVGAAGEIDPFLTLNISQNGKVLVNRLFHHQEISAAKGNCEVKIGRSVFKSVDDLNAYQIYVDPDENEGFGVDLTLEREVPSYRPGTGHWTAGKEFFGWLCAVPSGRITGSITAAGATTAVEGSGYHDHNWGNVPMDLLIKDWIWGRSEIDGITVVTASVRFRDDKGGAETPLLYMAKEDEVILDVLNDQLVCLEGVKVRHPDTGKKISSQCIYLYEDGGDHAWVRFDGQGQIIASLPWANSSDEWESWYARFGAVTTLDVNLKGRRIRAKAPSTLENMDFYGRRRAP